MIRRGSHLSDQCHKIAVDAIGAAKHPHHFIGVTKQGVTAVIETTGNDCCHVILRGGTEPNYSAEHVAQCSALMEKAGLLPRVMIDCSHGNSRKNHKNQPVVLKDVNEQVSGGNKSVCGVMIESNLFEGNQSLVAGQADKLKYGVSITDACVDWGTTLEMLEAMHAAVQARRTASA